MAKDEKKKESSGLLPFLIGVVIVAALGFGLGIGARSVLTNNDADNATSSEAADASQKDPKEATATTHTAKSDGHEKESAAASGESADLSAEEQPDNYAELIVVPLEPIITNLANPKTTWIRFEGSVLAKKETEVDPKVLSAQAAHQIIAYFRSMELRDLDGSSGLLHLNEDLNEVMRSFSQGEVRKVLISGFVVE